MSKMLYKSYTPDILAVFNDDFEVYSKEETEEIINSIKQDAIYVSDVSQFLITPELLQEYEACVDSKKMHYLYPQCCWQVDENHYPTRISAKPAGRPIKTRTHGQRQGRARAFLLVRTQKSRQRRIR